MQEILMESDAEIKIKIADITICFDRNGIDFGIELAPAYRPFFVDSQPDLITHLKDDIPDFSLEEVLFDAAPVWSLYREGKLWVMQGEELARRCLRPLLKLEGSGGTKCVV